MTEEEIKKMKADLEAAEKKAKEAEDALKEKDKAIEEKDKAIGEKDELIKQKNEDLHGQRKKYKKLADMSQEEKDELSQKELELQERQEAFEERQEKFEQEQKDLLVKEANARRDSVIKKLVGDNEEFAEKLKGNFESIKGSEEATTEDEIASFMDKAFNMLGDDKPDPVSITLGADGKPVGEQESSGFADTPEGKALESNMFPEGEGEVPDPTQNPEPMPDPSPDLNS